MSKSDECVENFQGNLATNSYPKSNKELKMNKKILKSNLRMKVNKRKDLKSKIEESTLLVHLLMWTSKTI